MLNVFTTVVIEQDAGIDINQAVSRAAFEFVLNYVLSARALYMSTRHGVSMGVAQPWPRVDGACARWQPPWKLKGDWGNVGSLAVFGAVAVAAAVAIAGRWQS
jgi:hypothetical protein